MTDKSEYSMQDDKEKMGDEKLSSPEFSQQFMDDQWQTTPADLDDPLLGCLVTITSLYDRPFSGTAFKAGLPLVNGRLTPELFVRAASRVGLSAKIVRKTFDKISSLTLPCVILLQGSKACILVALKDDEAEIILPEMGRGSQFIKIAELEKIFVGLAIFVRPQYRYDSRSAELDTENPRSWFWGTLAEFWPIYSQVALAALLINVFAIASPLFTMNVYDRVVPNNATDTLWVLASGIAIIYFFDLLLRTLRGYFVDAAGKNADIILASRLFEHVMGMKLSSRPTSSGGFANQLREFETLREFFSSVTLVALIDLPFIFLFIFIIYIIGGAVAYVPLVIVPLVVIVSIALQFPLRAWVKRMFREAAQKHSLLVEAINGLETIKSLGIEGRVQRNWESFVQQSSGSANAARFLSQNAINFSAFAQNLSSVAVVIVGVYLITEGKLTMGGLIACSILAGRALAPLAQVVGLLTRYNQSMTALNALDQIVNTPTERPKNKIFLHRPRFDGEVEFKDVVFRYPGQEMNALDHVSFHIKPGEKIGLIGKIGSGKSTIEKLILGLFTPLDGAVLIDSTDTRQLDPSDLRTNIGYIAQDVFLFYGSVRENLLMGADDATDGDMLRAARISGVDDFVRRHPLGYDMPVGESGSNVSGGQRQSIAVARALMRDPPILIFDEPTAMMDHTAEARFISRLNEGLGNKSLILVTHRMSLLTIVDRLLVMDNGKLVADGPRDDVLKALSGTQLHSAGK